MMMLMSTDQPSSTSDSVSASGAHRVTWSMLRDCLDAAGVLAGVRSGRQARDAGPRPVGQLADDSRMIRADAAVAGELACFIAIHGTTTDGHRYIDAAIENGARVVVCEELPERATTRYPGVVFARVTDGRMALAELAAAYYGHPSEALRMVGVTGTNGKTTVAYLMHHTLDALGEASGLISTIEVRTGAVSTNASLTTPGALELQRTLRRMVDDGCAACAMEVSSHALDQRRVHATHYDIAIFTNLTSEHLDYHGSFGSYRDAKKMLFDGLDADAIAVLNADDESAAAVGATTAARVVTYGRHPEADVRVEVLESRPSGLRLRLDGAERSFRLAGHFNAYNIAAAYTAARALGYDTAPALDVLEHAPPVPGRFEQLTFEDGTTVVVDYAHTPDALENILSAVRDAMDDDARLWCLFGCGGDRDPSKRRVMGSLAETLADRIVVTSDNPRTEEPEAIMNDIRRGMSHPNRATWIADREDAIRHAATHAAPGDVVLIAGKGHETYQVVGTRRRPFDDRKIARTYFGERERGGKGEREKGS
jgi:UDP-N-acetylmuramoyl-L-alanyl-D-glutamate--2,6-diaminopimelate ligase